MSRKRGRIFGDGEAVLRVMRIRARLQGDRTRVKQLTSILRNPESAAIAGVALEDVAEGGFFAGIIQWIEDHPDEWEKFIQMILKLLMGGV